jgi:hypothetical protein
MERRTNRQTIANLTRPSCLPLCLLLGALAAPAGHSASLTFAQATAGDTPKAFLWIDAKQSTSLDATRAASLQDSYSKSVWSLTMDGKLTVTKHDHTGPLLGYWIASPNRLMFTLNGRQGNQVLNGTIYRAADSDTGSAVICVSGPCQDSGDLCSAQVYLSLKFTSKPGSSTPLGNF